MPPPRPRSELLLIWLNLFLGVLCMVPCCFPLQFPVLTGILFEKMRPDFPEGTKVTPWQLIGLPFMLMYGIQLALVGIPALVAAIAIWRRSPYRWWPAVATPAAQSLLFLANGFALLLYGRHALLPLGTLVTLVLLAMQFGLLAANFTLLSAVAAIERIPPPANHTL